MRLWDALRAYVSLPDFTSPRDALVARYARRILIAILIFGILQIFSVFLVRDMRDIAAIVITTVVSICIGIAGIELLRRRHLAAASRLIVIVTGIGVTVTNLSLGGVDTPGYAAHAITILFAFMLLVRREALIAIMLTFAAMIGIYLIDTGGALTPSRATLVDHFGVIALVLMLLTAVLYFVAETLQKAIEDVVQKHEALARTERHFRALTEKSFGSVMLVDSLGTITYVSPTAKKVLGYDVDEMIGKNAAWPVHPEDMNRIVSGMQDVIERPHDNHSAIYRVQHKDGHLCWIEVVATNLLSDPDVGAIVLNYRDISERIEAEERRISSEVLYRTIVNTTYEGVWMLDNAGKTTLVNARMAEMLGYAVAEMIDRSFIEFLAADVHAEVDLPWEPRSDGSAVSDVVLRHRDGHNIWAIANTNLLYDTEGLVSGTLAMLTDITERKQAETELRRANRAFRVLSACNQELVRAIDQQELINNMVTTIVSESSIYTGAWIELTYTGGSDPVLWKAAYGNTRSREWIHADEPTEIGADAAGIQRLIVRDDGGTAEQLIRLPITTEDVTGALYVVAGSRSDDLGEAEMGLLAELAEDIGYGITSLNTRRDLERVLLSLEARNQDVSVLHEASKFIRETLDLDDICKKFYVVLDRAIGCETLVITRYQPDENEIAPLFAIRHHDAIDAAALTRMPLPEDEADGRTAVVRSAEPRVFKGEAVLPLINKCQKNARADGTTYGLFDPQLPPKSAILMPLPLNDQVFGLVEVYGTEAHDYSVDHLRLVESLASHVAVAINKAMLYQQAQDEIAERQRAEEALRRSEEKFRTMFNRAPDGVIIVDPASDQILEVNTSVVELLGYPAHRMIGSAFRALINSSSPETAASLHLHTDTMPSLSTIQVRRRDGSLAIVDLTLTTIPWLTGEVTAAYLRDASERLDLEAERIRTEVLQAEMNKERELVNLKSRFVSTVSHEFRTPLSVILSSSDILTRYAERMTPERHQEHLDRIRSHAMQMTDMLNDVLTLNKLQSGANPFQPSAIDLLKLCNDVLEQVRISKGEDHVLKFTWEGEIAGAVVDDRLLQHVLINLLTNAVKYSPVGSIVDLRLKRQGEVLVFEVQDSGIGIPEADQARMFEPFYRAVNASEIEGTGLGLAIVKEKVMLHGGSIDFVSQQGAGTKFVVRIPFRPLAEMDTVSSA